MRFPPQYWHWVMRLCALLFALVVLGTFLAPAGSALRFACYIAFPCLMVAYLWARGKARPNEEFQDTPWSA